MTCRPNYDISLKRSLWRCCGNFCSSMQWECCSIWPESKLWSGCTFDKINSRADLSHSAMIPHFCCAPTKTIAIWCAIKHVKVQVQQQAAATPVCVGEELWARGDHYLYFKTYFESNEVRWHYLLSTLSYCWQQMALFTISKSLPPPVCWVIICVCIGHERFILQ